VLILTVIQGPDRGRTFRLTTALPQLIGRSSEALPCADTTMSRRHAELTPDDGEWFIRDLNSQNGTYVNGVKIAERTRLRVGDQVRTGSTLFVFGRGEEDEDLDLVRVEPSGRIDTSIERTLSAGGGGSAGGGPGNDDSVILAEPEPRSAAVHHLQVIYRLTALTSQQTDREALLKGVMELVFGEFRPERGVIMLCEAADGKNPVPAVVRHRHRPSEKDEARISVSKTILSHALKHGEGVLSTNAMNDPRFAKGDSVQQFAIRSALCSPIGFGDRAFGAIYVDSTIANYTFTPEQLALLNAIGRHTGLALANAAAYAKKLETEKLAAVGETVATLSHSIKNILQGLRGGADVVEMGLRKDDLKIARGGWGILKRNIDRIMSLTANMLAYSRPRAPEYELTPIGALLEECAELLKDQCAIRQVALIVDADPETPPIMLDPSLIHQAMLNLMGNAVEAVEPKTGVVTVRASYVPGTRGPAGGKSASGSGAHRAATKTSTVNLRALGLSQASGWAQGPSASIAPTDGPMVRIEVIDNGPGIAPDRHAQIFEPFQTTKGIRGTGLGLAVTRRIVQEHQGKVLLASDIGRGATFIVLLPAELNRQADPSATTATRPL
jgi:two-component system, NtrC family, sensor kinase